MKNYSYLNATIDNVRRYIMDNDITPADYDYDRDEMESALNDDMFISDSITGNASGSYTFNRYAAMENVLGDFDTVRGALWELGYESDAVGKMFLDEDWEALDVIARCSVLGAALSDILDEMEEDGMFNPPELDDEDACDDEDDDTTAA